MAADAQWLQAHGDGVRITVRVVPRSSRSQVDGVRDGALRVRLAAPPVDGAANEELVRTLAEAVGVRRSAVHIHRGASGRTKVVEISGVTPDHVMRVTRTTAT